MSWKLSDEQIRDIHQWATSGYRHPPDFDTDRAIADAQAKHLAEKVLEDIDNSPLPNHPWIKGYLRVRFEEEGILE